MLDYLRVCLRGLSVSKWHLSGTCTLEFSRTHIIHNITTLSYQLSSYPPLHETGLWYSTVCTQPSPSFHPAPSMMVPFRMLCQHQRGSCQVSSSRGPVQTNPCSSGAQLDRRRYRQVVPPISIGQSHDIEDDCALLIRMHTTGCYF